MSEVDKVYVDDFVLPDDPPLDRLPHPALARAVAAVSPGGGIVYLGPKPQEQDS